MILRKSTFVFLLLTIFALVAESKNYGCSNKKLTLRVAAAQIPVSEDVNSNAEAIKRAIDFAIREKADILLTPEGSVSGYTPKFDQRKVEKALDVLTKKAKESKLALAVGTCYIEPVDKKCYDEIRFYDCNGVFLGFHSKILVCGTVLDEKPKGEINDYAVGPLRTFQIRGIMVGGLICNDLWANPRCTPMPDPHLIQELRKMGAKVILHAVNGAGGGEQSIAFHESQLKVRVAASKTWTVTVDNCNRGPEQICSSQSGVLDPNGNWIVKTQTNGEHFFVHTIDIK